MTTTAPTLTFDCYGQEVTVFPVFGVYANSHRLAVSFASDIEGAVGVLTVNLPEVDLRGHEIIVKDWSENELLFIACVQAGWITVVDSVLSGFTEPKICVMAGPLAEYAKASGKVL